MATPPQNPLYRNWLSVLGAIFTTVAALLFLFVFLLDLLGLHTNPYMGIVFFLVMPGAFVAGLLLIPIGMLVEHRRRKGGHEPSIPRWPRLDLNDSRQRRAFLIVSALTVANVLIVSLAAYRGIEYMDSVDFCGQVCHTVMQPEFTAYQEGPHSRVACVQCHIGPGAPWFVRSKLSGLRQVFAVTFNTYSKPIPSPVHNLRPARETCEQCHWPDQFHGDKVVAIHEFADDEKNSETTTNLQVHVGGVSTKLGLATGIHWHVGAANSIEYIATDDNRQVIPWVRMHDRNGAERVFRTPGVTEAQLARGERRTMDCVDCHNRPTHRFAESAPRAVDDAMALGEIDASLPFIKREAVASLTARYASREAAATGIATRLEGFYRRQYPQSNGAAVARAISATQHLYERNIFPSMRIAWATYPLNVGHTFFAGCFRCHDDNHKAADGSTIRQDCDLCHTMQ